MGLVLVSHYYHFKNWERFLEINQYEALKYSFGRNIFNLHIVSYLYHIALSAPLAVTAILGIFLGLSKKVFREGSLIILSPLLSFSFLYLYFLYNGLEGMYSTFHETSLLGKNKTWP